MDSYWSQVTFCWQYSIGSMNISLKSITPYVSPSSSSSSCPWHIFTFNGNGQRYETSATQCQQICKGRRKLGTTNESSLWICSVSFQHKTVKCDRRHEFDAYFKFLFTFWFIHVRLIKYFSGAYQPIIATLFSWSLTTISGCLLMIQLQIVVQYKLLLNFCTHQMNWILM